MYSGGIKDWYTGLGTQILMPKKHFSSFLFSVDLTMHLTILKWLRTQKMQAEEKNNERKRSKQKKNSQKSVFIHLTT